MNHKNEIENWIIKLIKYPGFYRLQTRMIGYNFESEEFDWVLN